MNSLYQRSHRIHLTASLTQHPYDTFNIPPSTPINHTRPHSAAMLFPFLSTYRHLNFLRVTFMLVILLLAVNTMSLPFGASAADLAEKGTYPRWEEKLGLLEGKWKALTGLQKRALGGRGKKDAGIKKRSAFRICPRVEPIAPHSSLCCSESHIPGFLRFLLIGGPFYRDLCSVRAISGGVWESPNGAFR